jgi:hypothetical protein
MAWIFQKVDGPGRDRGSRARDIGDWYTWSDEFLAFAAEWERCASDLPEPRLVQLSELVGTEYDRTFSLGSALAERPRLREGVLEAARGLRSLRVGERLMFFRDLLGDQGLSPSALHCLFAALRDALAGLWDDARRAMYAPLGSTGPADGAFPLHADLYVPRVLFNVFDDVPRDPSGATLLLSLSALEELAARGRRMPADVLRRLTSRFREVAAVDRYDEVFDLLHGAHPWVAELEGAMEQHQTAIKFESGEGYLLHDRRWLHGRTTPTGGVPRNRVHRLVFDVETDVAAIG